MYVMQARLIVFFVNFCNIGDNRSQSMQLAIMQCNNLYKFGFLEFNLLLSVLFFSFSIHHEYSFCFSVKSRNEIENRTKEN
jgi:hypothetical protein